MRKTRFAKKTSKIYEIPPKIETFLGAFGCPAAALIWTSSLATQARAAIQSGTHIVLYVFYHLAGQPRK